MSNAPTSIGKRNLFSEDDIRIETKNGTETLIYDPYNPVNRMITKTEIETLLQNYGIPLQKKITSNSTKFEYLNLNK